MPRSYPRISTRVLDDTDVPIQVLADLRSVSDSTARAIVDSLGKLRSVRIDVGPGIRPESLGKLAMVAHRIRTVELVELVGDSAAAVNDVKALLLLLWTAE